jgi:fatty-acyl-CoA synthase
MKTAFSTLGCPKWSFNEIFSTAKDLGFDGIEFRGVQEEIYTPKVKEFSKENIKATKQRFTAAGLKAPMFSSGAVLCSDNEGAVTEVFDYVDLCAAFGSSYVRALADVNPFPQNKIDEDLLVKNLDRACGYAGEKKVNICIETNGVFSDSDNILRVIKKVKRENLFIIWDIHHTFRYGGETPQKTFSRIGDYVRHVHVKDSVVQNGKTVYKLTGDGDVPIKEALRQLYNADYNGFICLEWVKRWAFELTDPGIAFPSFMFYIKDALKAF